jgi:hypothetical protein
MFGPQLTAGAPPEWSRRSSKSGAKLRLPFRNVWPDRNETDIRCTLRN